MRLTIPLVLATTLMSSGCGRSEANSQGTTQTVLTASSSLEQTKASPFTVQEVKLAEPVNLTAVYFSDDRSGWIGGGNKVFKTDDGGNSWKQVPIEAPTGADVAQILFINATTGWVLFKTESGYVLDNPNFKAWLFQTKDGGETWALQYEDKQVAAVRVAFSNQQNGWLTGIKYVASDGVKYTHLALRTEDEGNHWLDVSNGIARITSDKKDSSGDAVNDGVMDIVTQGQLTAHVITGRMRIIKTSDGGKNWEQVADLRQERVPMGITRFGAIRQRLWEAGSIDSAEGIRGSLTVQRPDKSWSLYNLARAFFTDAVALSENEFVTCGYIKERTTQKVNVQDGLILSTSNSGSSWATAYRNPRVRRINALATTDINHIWAVGEDGLILRVTRSLTN